MAYKHGVSVSEVATSVLPSVNSPAGIPVVFGTAPIGMGKAENVNKPVLCYTYAEAVENFGYVPPALHAESGLKKFEYSISEFIDCAFSKFGISPVVIINVLDPTTHKAAAKTTSVTLDTKTGSAVIAETGILPDSIELSNASTTYTQGTDFIAAFNEDGEIVLTSLKSTDGFKCATGTSLTFTANKTDPSKVDADDIVGGVSADGVKTGLELVEDIFPLFRLVPGTLIAPGFSGNPTVAATMAAKCEGINGVFKAISIVDIPTATVGQYGECAAWKNNNNIVDPAQIACWPMLRLDDVAYNMSTQLACLMPQVDADNGDVPYVSPSNKNFQMTGLTLTGGDEVVFGQDVGAYLNSQGVVTALNFIGGWVCWGNRTACYPGNTDVKDAFIPIRRMFNWVGNSLIQTFWQRVDAPLNRRQIDTIVDSANLWLNGLAARQYILGGRVEFREDENPTTDLMDGIARFHVYLTPPSPNRSIEFILEYDVNYLKTLFS